jgi:hypothetical protein
MKGRVPSHGVAVHFQSSKLIFATRILYRMAATGASPTSHTVIPYSTSAEVDDIYRDDCALVQCEFMHGAPRA